MGFVIVKDEKKAALIGAVMLDGDGGHIDVSIPLGDPEQMIGDSALKDYSTGVHEITEDVARAAFPNIPKPEDVR